MSNMPASPFLSSAVVERPAEASAVALSPPSDVAAGCPIQSSCGGVESRNAGRHWPSPSCEQLAKPMGNCNDRTEAGVAPGPQEATDCIGEIFVGARKLDAPRFVLDVERFMLDIEEPPLFLRMAVRA